VAQKRETERRAKEKSSQTGNRDKLAYKKFQTSGYRILKEGRKFINLEKSQAC